MITLHDFGNDLGWLVDISFGLSQLDGHCSWLMCEVARVPVTIALQAPSFVEKAEPVEVHFTLRLRDQLSM